MATMPIESRAQRVLLVDDNAFWSETLSRGLHDDGWEVTIQTDGLSAAEQLRADPPDALVTDFFLARIDGGKLCRLAKSVRPGIRTIIVTAGVDQSHRRSPTMYADAVIAKNRPKVVLEDLRFVLRELDEGKESLHDPVGCQRIHPRATTNKLHGLKRYLDALHEGIGDAVIGVDDRRRVYFLNSNACELLDVVEDQVLAKPIDEVLHISESHPLFILVAETLQKGGSAQPTTLDVNGSWLRVNVAGLESPDGRATALLIARDISDVKAAEQDRSILTRRLHQADKLAALGQLTAGISHEINNPLAAILPNLSTLQDYLQRILEYHHLREGGSPADELTAFRNEADLDEVLEDIPTIMRECQDAANRIRLITREMKQFARPQKPKGEEVRIEDVLNSALSLAGNELRFKATVIRNYQPTPSIVVSRTMLTQAFLNIMMNAAQAIEGNEPDQNWVQVATGNQNRGITIDISNSGRPIPEDEISKIFEPFYTTREVGSSLGLGLSLCYDAIRRHGGYIEVESGLKTPTRFHIWMPLDTGVARTQRQEIDTEYQMRGRVLIVDDEKMLRNSLRRILEPPHEVTLVSNGAAAIEIFERGGTFDVILCDLIMPRMTGMDLFREVQRRWPAQAERFAFLTGGTFSQEARDFLQEVENPRAYKPLEADEVKRLVSSCILGEPIIKDPDE